MIGGLMPDGFRQTRRALLLRAAMGVGLTSLLAACSTSAPQGGATSAPAAPTTAASGTSAPAAAASSGGRGGGGPLKILMWQGPTVLNPHLAQGTKDFVAARFGTEPLLTVSGDGTFSPVLATEVPSKDNG